MIVRYRTKIVQNGPYIRESSSPDDLETMADWRNRVSVSEHQLQKLRQKLNKMDEDAKILDSGPHQINTTEVTNKVVAIEDADGAQIRGRERSLSSDQNKGILKWNPNTRRGEVRSQNDHSFEKKRRKCHG